MSVNNLKASPACFAVLKFEEGLRLTAYRNKGDVWTNGYGHTGADVFEGQVITEAQADAWLARDIGWAEAAVNAAVKVPLTQPQFDALVSLTFNLGAGKVMNERESTLLRLLNAGYYGNALTPDNDARPLAKLSPVGGASGQFAVWRVSGIGIDPRLIRRRAREGALFLSGTTVHLGTPDQPDMRIETLSEVSFGLEK